MKHVMLVVLMTALALVVHDQATAQGKKMRMLDPDVWHLRVINPADAHGKLCARVYVNPNQDPWYTQTVWLARDGVVWDKDAPEGTLITPEPPRSQWLNPGETSEWMDLGVHMAARPSFGDASDYLAPVFIGARYEPEAGNLRLIVELANGRDKRTARRIEVSDDHPNLLGYATWLNGEPKLPTLGLLVPVNPSPTRRIYTLEEAAEQQLKWLDECGPASPQSKFMLFTSTQRWVSFKNPTRLEKMQVEIVRRLGYNNLTQYARDAEDIEAIKAMGVTPLPARMILLNEQERPVHSVAEMLETLRESARAYQQAGVWDYIRVVSFGDEYDVINRISNPQIQDAAFVEHLQEMGCKPLDFVRPNDEEKASLKAETEQWEYVHLTGALPVEKPKLFYEAGVFRYELWGRELAKYTRQVKASFPLGTETGINWTPHMSVWPDVRRWVNINRDGGMTMPWSEDWWWGIPEASPQTYGYLLSALRHAADYHNSPVAFYVIPCPGQSAENLLRMSYYALGNQVKVLNNFIIAHQGMSTSDYIDFIQSQQSFRSIHRITSEVAKIDERLYRARMRPAEVAILMLKANDVWDTENLLTSPDKIRSDILYWADMNVDNHERKALFLALRHANIPVDLITDDDVAAGELSKYKVLYLTGQELLSEAVPKLTQWVKDGGILVASGGGGLLNQYREPMPAMYSLYGVESANLERPIRGIRPNDDLPKMKPLDTMTFQAQQGEKATSIPVLCYKQTMKPTAEAAIIAAYADGTPAAVEHEIGKGRAVLLGGLPGLAYLRPALAERKGFPNVFPEVFPPDVRDLIVGWTTIAKVGRHIVTSDPLVDATLQEGPLGAIVTLTNFRTPPLGKVTVSIPGLPKARKITSLRHGKLKVTHGKNGPTVSLPLDQGDFLLID